jgi:hypothetical protein
MPNLRQQIRLPPVHSSCNHQKATCFRKRSGKVEGGAFIEDEIITHGKRTYAQSILLTIFPRSSMSRIECLALDGTQPQIRGAAYGSFTQISANSLLQAISGSVMSCLTRTASCDHKVRRNSCANHTVATNPNQLLLDSFNERPPQTKRMTSWNTVATTKTINSDIALDFTIHLDDSGMPIDKDLFKKTDTTHQQRYGRHKE